MQHVDAVTKRLTAERKRLVREQAELVRIIDRVDAALVALQPPATAPLSFRELDLRDRRKAIRGGS